MKDIPGYEGLYATTEDGSIYSYRSRKFLKKSIGTEYGYELVSLTNRLGCPRKYYVHRLVAACFLGMCPKQKVDHKDRNPTNNSVINLRIATDSQNSCNSRIRKDNTSGFKGVSMHHSGKWRARIYFQGKAIVRHGFEQAFEAANWRDSVAADMHGDFATHN